MSRFILSMTVLASLLSCTTSSAAGRDRLAAGVWGGPHIRLDVAEDGTAAVELDCAHGSTTEPIVLDGKGAFRAAGTFARESHGPIREGQKSTDRPAVYTGKVEGDQMTLTITLTGSNEEQAPGSFELTQGKTPRLTKCM